MRIIGELGTADPAARGYIDEQLDRAACWLAWTRTFYAVGGAWRNLARLHMAQTHYPLTIIQRYTLDHSTALSLAELRLPAVAGHPERHRGGLQEPLRHVAAVGAGAGAHARPQTPAHVTTSVYGVREGVLYGNWRSGCATPIRC